MDKRNTFVGFQSLKTTTSIELVMSVITVTGCDWHSQSDVNRNVHANKTLVK
jgi:hypothetical protein